MALRSWRMTALFRQKAIPPPLTQYDRMTDRSPPAQDCPQTRLSEFQSHLPRSPLLRAAIGFAGNQGTEGRTCTCWGREGCFVVSGRYIIDE